MKRIPQLATLILLSALPACKLAGEISSELVTRLKPGVVNVEYLTSIGLDNSPTGKFSATGFVVDAAKGIIATNHHVTGTGPTKFKITFENGFSTEAKAIYYDAWHDFGFLQYDPAKLSFTPLTLPLISSSNLHEQDEVFMIGNNDAQEYSIKFGRVTNLVLTKGSRHSATIQTSFDRAGGSSGSPVFNQKGEVVAIHYSGTDTTSFELKGDYLLDALLPLRSGTPVVRGDAGLVLDVELISEARSHLHFPENAANEIFKMRPGIKRLILVTGCIPSMPAADKLQPGDVITAVDGHPIGDDLYLIDHLVDLDTGKSAVFEVYRGGNELKVSLAVKAAENLKSHRFLQFAGGVIQTPTPDLRFRNNISDNGVYLTHADSGSTMSTLGYPDDAGGSSYRIMILAVNGMLTPDLESFLKAIVPLRDGDKIYMTILDKNSRSSGPRARLLDLDIKYYPLKDSNWQLQNHDWFIEEVSGKH